MENITWKSWFEKDRFGTDDIVIRNQVLQEVDYIRDEILRCLSALSADATVIDFGCGDGFLGIQALLDNPNISRLIFCDRDPQVLDLCRTKVQSLKFLSRSQFVRSSATAIKGISDESVDAIIFRAVLMYITEKQKIFDELFRVLKGGGVVSFQEPVNKYSKSETLTSFRGLDCSPIKAIILKIKEHQTEVLRKNKIDLYNYDERDLISMVKKSGFKSITVNFHYFEKALPILNVDYFFNYKPNTYTPSLGESINNALTKHEKENALSFFNSVVNVKKPLNRKMASIYVTAFKCG